MNERMMDGMRVLIVMFYRGEFCAQSLSSADRAAFDAGQTGHSFDAGQLHRESVYVYRGFVKVGVGGAESESEARGDGEGQFENDGGCGGGSGSGEGAEEGQYGRCYGCLSDKAFEVQIKDLSEDSAAEALQEGMEDPCVFGNAHGECCFLKKFC